MKVRVRSLKSENFFLRFRLFVTFVSRFTVEMSLRWHIYRERLAEKRLYDLSLKDSIESHPHTTTVAGATIDDVRRFFRDMGRTCFALWDADGYYAPSKTYAISFRIGSRRFGENADRKTTQKQRLPTAPYDEWDNDLEFVFSPHARLNNRLSIRYRGKKGEFCAARMYRRSLSDMDYASQNLFEKFFGLPRPFFIDHPNWRLIPVVLKMSYERETFFATVPRDIIVYGVLRYLLSR